MVQSVRTWLALLVIPLFLGVLIHFIVPLEFILVSTPKIEEAYNSYKIDVEQFTIRSMAQTNSKVVQNRLQIYENILAKIIRHLDNAYIYDQINFDTQTQTKVNDSYSESITLTDDLIQQLNLNKSLWFTNSDSIFTNETGVLSYYCQILPYIEKIFQNQVGILHGLERLEVMFIDGMQQLYFEYPPLQNKQVMTQDQIMNSKEHFAMRNYQENGFTAMVFDQTDALVISNIVCMNGYPVGVFSLGINIQSLIQDLTSSLSIPEFQFSTNFYYLLRPSYNIDSSSFPQIVANFTSDNFSQVSIPNSSFFNITYYGLSPSLFQGDDDYKLSMLRSLRSQTFYTIPLTVNQVNKTNQIYLYFLTLNDFEKSTVTQESYMNQIKVVMIVPTVILLFISVLVTYFVLRYHLKTLEKILNKLVDSCSLILKGDLNLSIKHSEMTTDLEQLYQEFEALNKLSKYSDPDYFRIPKPERIIRYLQAYQFFNQHKYNTANLCENIADCYNGMGETTNAIDFMKKAIEIDMNYFKEKYGGLENILQEKLKYAGDYDIDKQTKFMEKALSRKIRKQALFLYANFKPNDTATAKYISELTETLRKLIYPRVQNLQYIGALVIEVRYKLRDRDFTNLQENLERLDSLITFYEQKHRNYDEDCNSPPDVVRSYWAFMSAVCKMKDRNMLAAYDFYVRGLYGNYFNPLLHAYTQNELKRILDIFKVDSSGLKDLKYNYQQKQRGQRQYIFMVDVSNPDFNKEQSKYWRKQNLSIAQHIFNNFITEKDRVSINQFCHNIEISCNLVGKSHQQKLLKNQLSLSFKCRKNRIFANLVNCVKKVNERVKHLLSEKIFVIFLKRGMEVNGQELATVIDKQCSNSIFMIITEDREIISERGEKFYVFEYEDVQDINRVLEEKTIKYSDNKIYLF